MMNTFEVNYKIYDEIQEPMLITTDKGMMSVRKMFYDAIALNHWRNSAKIISIDFIKSC